MVGEVDNLKLSVFERGIYLVIIMNIFQVVLGKVSSDSLMMKCISLYYDYAL